MKDGSPYIWKSVGSWMSNERHWADYEAIISDGLDERIEVCGCGWVDRLLVGSPSTASRWSISLGLHLDPRRVVKDAFKDIVSWFCRPTNG
jgi:hypothetical protein